MIFFFQAEDGIRDYKVTGVRRVLFRSPLERVQAPFHRISYTDAVAKLKSLGTDMEWGRDLGGDDETTLAKEYDRPVFVYRSAEGRGGEEWRSPGSPEH